MKLAVPRMGNLSLIIEDVAERFSLDFIETPEYTEETMRIGAALSPEFVCLPLKAVLGGFIQALEAGADTLVTGGGSGPCRFGYYAEIQRRILEREGYRFDMIVLDPPSTSPAAFHGGLRSLVPRSRAGLFRLYREIMGALSKVVVFDELEKWALATRGIEAEAGAVDQALDDCRRVLSGAFSRAQIEEARRFARKRFGDVPVDKDRRPLKVGIVGEIFVVLEPYFNFDIERWLGTRGAVAERAVHISDTVYPMGRNPVFGHREHQVARAAAPFLSHEVGGDGLLSVGATVIFAKKGFDAVIHFLPFTCMPEVIAKSVLGRVSAELGIPLLSLTIDEQTGRAGVETRLEAVMDLARANRERSRMQAGCLGAAV